MNSSQISPLAFIGPGVEIGERVSIGPHAVLLGPCSIGDDAFIGAGAQIGAPPEVTDRTQNAAWTGVLAHAGVVIGSHAVIRESAVIHQGTHRPTTVGAGAWVLNRAYLAHDVAVGDRSTISAGVSIGGHCVIGSLVNIGMNASIHQRTFVGTGSMVGMGTPLARDLPPFVKAFGSPARIHGVNTIGMERQGIHPDEIQALLSAYRSGDLMLEEDESDWTGQLGIAVSEWRARDLRRPARSSL
ncbi:MULTISPECIES: acyl-ACP--UDP-N- acetylglucosamine O-acyltransferase [unclassified Leucobacter]|uniref:acyl-ACP--UDP-N- acetylglucosamine O-acyltransferase n=1 Tax=unclassified Leucobacter TaxID=2621730 RepID=UPI00165DA848|nr:acyl-ACP--UDP-N- acetylglucosamine O-acyltransferase [Leucobacter sp. cx-87]